MRGAVVSLLAEAYVPLVPRLDKGMQCSLPLLALAKAQYGQGRGAEVAEALLEQLVTRLLAAAKPQELANALYALGELHEDCGFQPEPRHLRQLAEETAGRLHAEAARAAGGGLLDPKLAQQLSNSLLACAKLGARDPAVLLRLAEAVAILPSAAIQSQECANSLWALAKLKCSGPEYRPALQRLSNAAVQLTSQPAPLCKPQELASALWALGTLSCSGPEHDAVVLALCREARRQLLERPGSFAPQALSNMLLGLANMGRSGPEYHPVVEAVCAAMGSRLRPASTRITAQALSNSLWALATLELTPRELGMAADVVAAAAAECERRSFAGFKSQELSNTVWAFAKLGYDHVDLYAAAAQAAAQPSFAQTATTQGKASLLYGFALVGYQPQPSLLHGWSWGSANAQECANSLWALAGLQLWEPELVQPLASRLQQLLKKQAGQANVQELVNSLWALTVMGSEALLRSSELVETLLRELARRWAAEGAAFVDEILFQLWQAQQELQAAADNETAQRLRAILLAAGGGKLSEAMQEAVLGQQLARSRQEQSQLQQDVAAALGRLQQAQGLAQAGGPRIASVASEVALEGVCGPADVVVQLRQEAADGPARQWRLAVEVDGPSHFLLNRPEEVDGGTELRNRQLRRALQAEGGRLVCVPYREWNALKSRAQEEAYLRARVLEGAAS
jgi:hypothetical protein